MHLRSHPGVRSVVRPVHPGRSVKLSSAQQGFLASQKTADSTPRPTQFRLDANSKAKIQDFIHPSQTVHGKALRKIKIAVLLVANQRDRRKWCSKAIRSFAVWGRGREVLVRQGSSLSQTPAPGSSKAWERKPSLRDPCDSLWREADRRHSVSSVGRVCVLACEPAFCAAWEVHGLSSCWLWFWLG